MMSASRGALRATLLALLLVLPSVPGPRGQEAPDSNKAGVTEGWKELVNGPEPDAAELAVARAELAGLSARQVAVLDCLRFLARPEWTREVFPHAELDRRLAPLDQPGAGPLNLDELHRLWGLLQAGWPDDAALRAAVARLAETPVRIEGGVLTQALAIAMTARAAMQRGIGESRVLGQCIRRAWEDAQAACKAAAALPRGARGYRTTCLLSTTLLWRVAMEQKLPVPANFMDNDFDLLAADLSRGAAPGPGVPPAHALKALAEITALSLAADPVARCDKARKLLADSREKVIQRCESAIRHFRVGQQYRSAYGAYLGTLDEAIRPSEFKKADEWRKWKLDNVRYWSASNGAMLAQDAPVLHPTVDDGVRTPEWLVRASFHHLPRVEGTALTLIGLTGGLLPAKPGRRDVPLVEWTPEVTQRLMRARTMVAAHDHNRLTDGLRLWIPQAIQQGCEQLVSAQAADGSINTQGSVYVVGFTALAGLALLHGGYDRRGPAVSGVLRFLEGATDDRMQRSNYEAACVLLFLQRYYLPEQSQALAAAPAQRRQARKAVWGAIGAQHQLWINKLAAINETSQCGRGGAWSYFPSAKPDQPDAARPPEGGEPRPETGKQPKPGQESPDNKQPGDPDADAPPEYPSAGDHSNTQYAWLGLWCAAMLGRDIDVNLLRGELRRMARTFKAMPSEAPVPVVLPTPESESRPQRVTSSAPGKPASEMAPVGGWSYKPVEHGAPPDRAMTAAMMGNVRLVMEELEVLGAADAESRALARRLVAGSMAFISHWLPDHAMSMDRPPRVPALLYYNGGPGASGATDLYYLYTIERSCMMAGVRVLYGNEDWYRSGALFLQHTLPAQGQWPCSTLDTAWVVLFLKRAVPDAPPPVPQPKGPTTGDKKDG
ncbi:MAG: hypothetical protein KF754_16000 [Planctomycetes bacterium]|nr:hypothetical protein [Planctomycetota bacterium]